jgi:hypothetical protein
MIVMRATTATNVEDRMSKSIETLMIEAVGEHWDEVITANDRLLERFDDLLREACPSLRFRAESDADGLVPGNEYAIAVDYLYVVNSPDGTEGARVTVELHNVDQPDLRPVDVDHVALLDHLGLLDD